MNASRGRYRTSLAGFISALLLSVSTDAENTAATGGGIWNDGSTVTAKNTIIALNNATDFQGTLTSQGYNIIGTTNGTTITGTTTGNQTNVNPMLGPLQDNGGPDYHARTAYHTGVIELGNNIQPTPVFAPLTFL